MVLRILYGYKNASVGYERYQKLLLKILFKLVHGSDLEDNLGVIFTTKDQSPDEPNQRTQETSIFASIGSRKSMNHSEGTSIEASNDSSSTSRGAIHARHAEEATKRLYTIYEQVFFDQYNMWFLCLLDLAESTEIISYAFRLFIEILQNTESKSQERHIQFMLLQFEYALTQHCHSIDIYILLIAFLIGVPVNQLPKGTLNSPRKDVTSILNEFKAANAANKVPVNHVTDEDANAIMSMITNLLREHMRRTVFPEHVKFNSRATQANIFHRRAESTDSGYYGENEDDSAATTDDDDQRPRLSRDYNENFINDERENAIAVIVAHIFLVLMEEDERFKHRCSSKEFMKQIVKFIFSCASQNDATLMRENSEAVSFSVKIIEEYVDAAQQDISKLDHDTGDSDEPEKVDLPRKCHSVILTLQFTKKRSLAK